jgi:DNA repair exonuclease SbcCD nuclease subunit
MLQNEGMIVRLSIGTWTARKFDQKATQEVAAVHEVQADVGRYNKVLIAKESLKDITAAVSAARTFHYDNTLPWDDGGGRLLTAKNFFEYSKKMNKLKTSFEDAVRSFLNGYPVYRNEARKRLGSLFILSDYPGVTAIKSKFDFNVDFEPVPVSGDFRVELQKKDVDKIRKEIDDRLSKRVAEATKDLFGRLKVVVEKFIERLSEEDAIFRDTLVNNIIDIVELIPRLNIANDPNLSSMRKEIERRLCSFTPEVLRADKVVRKQAVDDATDILSKMIGYIK